MKIIVIGAGISGLTFATAMQRLSPTTQVEVYERDQSLTSRPQGYSLGLNGDMGLAVLKTLGLYEHLAQEEMNTITNFVFCTQHGQHLLELPVNADEKHLRQRVKRRTLKAALVVQASSEAELGTQSPTELLHRVQQATQTWHSPIPELVTAIDPTSIEVRGYYDREPLTRVREARLWLIGDAGHPMAPFQGQGANLGMMDSLELAQYFAELISTPDQNEEQARILEAQIISRGRKAVLESRAAARRFHITNLLQQRWRNISFRIGNFFIQQSSRRNASPQKGE
jgi:2-polyprenyl-6-methoxyphenol hydroxylase-like FAD-dependent oxidoreductase